jgi:DNA repair exonuclease SbcCD nuclease subunit
MAVIRFIHSADWHLGKSLHEHALLEDQRKVLWDLIRLIEEENPIFWSWPEMSLTALSLLRRP